MGEVVGVGVVVLAEEIAAEHPLQRPGRIGCQPQLVAVGLVDDVRLGMDPDHGIAAVGMHPLVGRDFGQGGEAEVPVELSVNGPVGEVRRGSAARFGLGDAQRIVPGIAGVRVRQAYDGVGAVGMVVEELAGQ